MSKPEWDIPKQVPYGRFADEPKLRDQLRKPFAEIGKLPRKTKTGQVFYLDYVGHAAVTDRLNAVFPDWTWKLDHVETYLDGDGAPHVAGIIGTLTIGDKGITEGGDPDKVSSYGDELKLAISDFIRRGAMRFGVALDLWSKEDLESRATGKRDAESAAGGRPSGGGNPVAPTGGGDNKSPSAPTAMTPSSTSGSGGKSSIPPSKDETVGASSQLSTTPSSDGGVRGDFGEGSLTPPSSEHTHEWEPAPNKDAADRGYMVCKTCRVSKKDPV